jgi:hypothetical protein
MATVRVVLETVLGQQDQERAVEDIQNATTWYEKDGVLTVVNQDNEPLAIYPKGKWVRARVLQS